MLGTARLRTSWTVRVLGAQRLPAFSMMRKGGTKQRGHLQLQLPGEPQDTAMGVTVGDLPRSRSPQGGVSFRHHRPRTKPIPDSDVRLGLPLWCPGAEGTARARTGPRIPSR